MEVNAGFVDSIYDDVKQPNVYKDHFVEKNIVVVLDNAPAHNQTENLVRGRCDLVLLRLGPYSPMCNPIEGTSSYATSYTQCALICYVYLQLTGCFSALKARIKAYLVLSHEAMMKVSYGQKSEL
ncbi:unnamed protein product [Phytophthora fragariaefolia]|uniref:Unnamed protein product n=1 Tax=Phytophthora fragariaefolia TaxID=1490495 RepID=A0A9W7CS03_9STRA|nr:unnamed protein product [Phytophthora fragariaefolia]